MPPPLSPTDAVRIAQRARRLLRCGKINHTAYCVLDSLLWSARPKGAGHAVISYNGLAKLAHLAKATISRAIVTLEAVGLISKVKRRALFPWASGGLQARNLANKYILNAPTAHEFTWRSVIKCESILITAPAVMGCAQAALEARRREIEGRMRLNKEKVSAAAGTF